MPVNDKNIHTIKNNPIYIIDGNIAQHTNTCENRVSSFLQSVNNWHKRKNYARRHEINNNNLIKEIFYKLLWKEVFNQIYT